jgi:hypothetical protein
MVIRDPRKGKPEFLGAPGQADQICYGKALALADSRGMRPLVAHCHLGLATLHRGIGDGLTAREHLSTAATMYREMDMRFWLEQAEATTQEG